VYVAAVKKMILMYMQSSGLLILMNLPASGLKAAVLRGLVYSSL
jgi:hypothetical protein